MITATFVDPQGVQQTDAVVYVRQATHASNSYESYLLDTSDFTTEHQPQNQVAESINCSFYYWTNAAAKDTGKVPYILANTNEADMDFSFKPDAAYDGLTLKQKAEKYFTDAILPTLV